MFQRMVKQRMILIVVVFFLVASTVLIQVKSPSSSSVYAQSETTAPELEDSSEKGFIRKDLYSSYLEMHEQAKNPQQEYFVQGEEFISTDGMRAEVIDSNESMGRKAVKTEELGSVTWEVDVQESGLYNIGIKYFPIEGKSSSIEREFYINGKLPFQGAATLTFPRSWENELAVIERDNRNNDLRPRQVENPIWMETDLKDAEGYYTEPYLFHFEKEG